MRIRTEVAKLFVRPLASMKRALAARENPDNRYDCRAKHWTGPFIQNLEAELVSLDSILHGF
jgi:hypothetical protein